MGYARGDFSISEDISDKIFSIPMHPYLDETEQDRVISALRKALTSE